MLLAVTATWATSASDRSGVADWARKNDELGEATHRRDEGGAAQSPSPIASDDHRAGGRAGRNGQRGPPHMAALKRDGIVEQVGTQRDTGGKPARVYALTGEGEELFPKAYALVLGELVEEIARVDGWERATEVLRAVGQRAGTGAAAPADCEGRVAVAAAALRSLGRDVEVQRTEQG
jgi:hypothetical protein